MESPFLLSNRIKYVNKPHETMPERARAIFILCHYAGFTYEEIQKAFQCKGRKPSKKYISKAIKTGYGDKNL